MISEEGDIRDQWKEKIDGTGGEIDGNARDIPEQGRSELGKLDDIQHPVGPSEIHQDIAHTEKEDKNGDDFCRSGDRPSPFRLGETKDGRDECPRMADPDEEDEVGDIDSPEDRPRQSGHTQSMAVLIKVSPYRPEDDGDEDGEGEVEGLSCLSDGLKQNGVLFQSQLFFFHHIPSDR